MFRFRNSLIVRALLLGVATGLRSQMANGMLALHHDDAPQSEDWRDWPVFRNGWGRKLLIASAMGELVGDKLPMTPSRLEPGPLAGRIAFGALAGAAIGSEYNQGAPVLRGAIFGTAGAVIGNYGGYHIRKAVVEATGLPDPAVAMAEDVIAVSLASTAVQAR